MAVRSPVSGLKEPSKSLLLTRSKANRARSRNRYASATSTSGSPPSVAEKRPFGRGQLPRGASGLKALPIRDPGCRPIETALYAFLGKSITYACHFVDLRSAGPPPPVLAR